MFFGSCFIIYFLKNKIEHIQTTHNQMLMYHRKHLTKHLKTCPFLEGSENVVLRQGLGEMKKERKGRSTKNSSAILTLLIGTEE